MQNSIYFTLSKHRSFQFGQSFVTVAEENGQAIFIASEVCKVLEIANHRDAISNLDNDEKGVAIADTLGGKQRVSVVNESGLYHLIFNSRKPQAVTFRKWVTGVLLPQLRRTGSYTVARKHIYPAQLSSDVRAAFQNLARFLSSDDFKAVAAQCRVSVSHVRKVATGCAVSARVLSILIKRAAINKQQGREFAKRNAMNRPDYVAMLSVFSQNGKEAENE